MWKHETRDTIFCLCVDDFGVKYFSKEDVQHLHDTIATEYTCKIDWKGENFLGYTIKWDYEKGHVDISMPDYIRNALKKLLYKTKVYPQYSPHEHTAVNWTNKGERQYSQQPDDYSFLDKRYNICTISSWMFSIMNELRIALCCQLSIK